jgi:hypothetical protein
MRLPNISAGAVRNPRQASRRPHSDADAVFPQLVICHNCIREPDNPGSCVRKCCAYKFGEELNCWKSKCTCR